MFIQQLNNTLMKIGYDAGSSMLELFERYIDEQEDVSYKSKSTLSLGVYFLNSHKREENSQLEM